MGLPRKIPTRRPLTGYPSDSLICNLFGLLGSDRFHTRVRRGGAVLPAVLRRTDEHFSQAIGTGTGDVRFRRMESDVVYRLVELLPMGRNLLNTRFRIQIPKTYRTIVT